MLFPSCRRILLFPLVSSPHGSNKVTLDPSCTWIRCMTLDTLMYLSILTWLKHSKPMHSMPLSMPLSWTESLDHLEHVMGPCWCFWAGPHHKITSIRWPIRYWCYGYKIINLMFNFRNRFQPTRNVIRKNILQ